MDSAAAARLAKQRNRCSVAKRPFSIAATHSNVNYNLHIATVLVATFQTKLFSTGN